MNLRFLLHLWNYDNVSAYSFLFYTDNTLLKQFQYNQLNAHEFAFFIPDILYQKQTIASDECLIKVYIKALPISTFRPHQ